MIFTNICLILLYMSQYSIGTLLLKGIYQYSLNICELFRCWIIVDKLLGLIQKTETQNGNFFNTATVQYFSMKIRTVDKSKSKFWNRICWDFLASWFFSGTDIIIDIGLLSVFYSVVYTIAVSIVYLQCCLSSHLPSYMYNFLMFSKHWCSSKDMIHNDCSTLIVSIHFFVVMNTIPL